MLKPSPSRTIDLKPEQAQIVREILAAVLYDGIDESGNRHSRAWVFGSRATGRARPYSDLDILISTARPLDWQVLLAA